MVFWGGEEWVRVHRMFPGALWSPESNSGRPAPDDASTGDTTSLKNNRIMILQLSIPANYFPLSLGACIGLTHGSLLSDRLLSQ